MSSHQADTPALHRNPALLPEKPPPPLSLQYTHLRLGAVSPSCYTQRHRLCPRPCTLPGATGPVWLPLSPISLSPQEGRCHHPRRAIPSTPARAKRPSSRNFSGTTFTTPPPAFPPCARPDQARAEPRPYPARRCGGTQNLGVREGPGVGQAQRHRLRPHAPRTCLLRLGAAATTAPLVLLADSTAAGESLARSPAEKRWRWWWQRRWQRRRRERGLET
jgi:hypothetical protein